MSPIDDVVCMLKRLRLTGMLESLELRTREALEDNLGHAEFFLRILTDEVERRESKQLERRLRKAGFEHRKTFEEFDFHFNPRIPKTKVIDLSTCLFVERKESVILIGPTGVGKSHIAQALGHRACLLGHSVLYLSAQDLFKHLRAARADDRYEHKLHLFTSPQLLIIDDLGLRPLVGDEPLDLYEIIRLRYERGALVMTSNRAIEELPPLFGDPLLASAAMDRLMHHAHVVVIEGDSFRNPPKKRTGRSSPDIQPQAKEDNL